ncbi:hypothetical protein ACN47E_005185 [Coniothyrium glycines]
MGRPFLNSIPSVSRTIHNYRIRFAIVLFILVIIRVQNLVIAHRQSLAAKYSPTTFNVPQGCPEFQDREPHNERLELKDELLASRASWTVLGSGWEGKVFSYKSYVIKTFTPGRSPFRNCAPGLNGERWPTEIPASLLFGHSSTSCTSYGHVAPQMTNTTIEGILPVLTCFKSVMPAENPEGWHLVTPLLEGGSLPAFSQVIRKAATYRTWQEIDDTYRPAFDRVLASLQSLHRAGYCHDDIKPANIFVRNDTTWVLGDLGNVREIFHPYHSSRLWKDNGQLHDCRANDVMRALKSYTKFVRSSTLDEAAFDRQFFEGQDSLSRLFWWSLSDAASMTAAELRHRSQTEYPGSSPAAAVNAPQLVLGRSHKPFGLCSRRLALKIATDTMLTTRIGEKMARFWGMVWLFGVPLSDTCGL